MEKLSSTFKTTLPANYLYTCCTLYNDDNILL